MHTLRDPTRGGLASALNELAETAACELLGLAPLHVANEGCLVAFVAPTAADAVLHAMHTRPEGARRPCDGQPRR
ncbi:AIR synthase-related protein [Actinomadura sp. 1N219]|uniref:AIR synthase-related protein n=1 Tax=Actinomadura sp. 1N219 TaxID=3375152 RepID=UPI0037B8486C